MTWTATQPELPSRMAADDLSEPAALAHWQAIVWVQATERFDCRIPRRLLPAALPLTANVPAVEKELTAAGYWRTDDSGVELIDHAGYTQRSLVRVQKKRRTDADASKRYRDKSRPYSASVTDAGADVSTDDDPDVSSEQAPRLPTELTTDLPLRNESEQEWPEVAVPGPRSVAWHPRLVAGYDN